MILSVFLVTASLASLKVGSLGSRHPELFAYTSLLYAVLSLFFAFSIHNSWPSYVTQCRVQLLTDIVIAIILYHASTGRGAGLEILLFISVSASGILLGGRGALTTASIATILLILEHFFLIATDQRTLGGFTTLGFLGGGLFITAFIIYYLSLLLRKTEGEVAQQSQDLQKLGHINELIVEQLHSGVLVIDQSLQPILINQSGRNLLGLPATAPLPTKLDSLLPEITLDAEILEGDSNAVESKITLPSGKKILTRYKPLGETFENGYIILLDDYSQIEREQSNEKFISMGRLSASIAHEIRNPLGAISHAGQLLAESPAILKNDSRLVEIIENQSQRINQIVKTILELGQTDETRVEEITLVDWLQEIVDGFIAENKLDPGTITLKGSKDIVACGDPAQLQHVVQNLLSNGLKYASTHNTPCIEISCDESLLANTVSVVVNDNGPGITEEVSDKMFEPFFTTSSTGNGLGLYIARKISLSNHGQLNYIRHQHGDGFFRLTLPGRETCHKVQTA